MTQEHSTEVQSNASFQRRLTSYCALFAAGACAAALAPEAQASVVYSGPLNVSVPASAAGNYTNLVTFAIGASYASVSGGDATAPAVNL